MKTMICFASSLMIALGLGCGDEPQVTPDAGPSGTNADAPGTATIRMTIGDEPGHYAFQDGEGEWMAAPAAASGVIELPIRSSTFAVAALCEGSRFVRARYRAASEGDFSFRFCGSPPTSIAELAGTLLTRSYREHAMSHGNSYGFVDTTEETAVPFSLSIQAETADLSLTRHRDLLSDPDVLYVERDVRISAVAVRDFELDALPPPTAIPQPSGSGAEAHIYEELITPTTTAQIYDYAPPLTFLALAPALRRDTDRYYVSFGLATDDGSSFGSGEIVASPRPQTPPATNRLAPPTVTPGVPMRVEWTPIEGATFSARTLSPSGGGSASFSNGWIATQREWAVPDLSGIPSWPVQSGFRGELYDLGITAVIAVGTYPEIGFRDEFHSRTVVLPDPAPAAKGRAAIEHVVAERRERQTDRREHRSDER